MDFSTLPLPPPWRCVQRDDAVIYINDLTGEETTTHPLAEYFADTGNADDTSTVEYKELQEVSPEEEEQHKTNEHQHRYLPFRCEWKEVTLNGLAKAYGMDLLYFQDDKHFEITFDGVHASWILSKIDGPYGPIDEKDLFIGAKIHVFGRHLSITSSNSHVCHMVDKRAEALMKRRAWLQDKIGVFGKNLKIKVIDWPSG
jgi:hypothetical protein